MTKLVWGVARGQHTYRRWLPTYMSLGTPSAAAHAWGKCSRAAVILSESSWPGIARHGMMGSLGPP